MKFANPFEEKEYIGRESLKDLISLFPEKFKNIEMKYTEDYYCAYDAFFFDYDENYSIKKRTFVEIKCREQVYPDYILETKKYNSIKRIAEKELYLKPEEYRIIYINFTPKGTYFWNISDMSKQKIEKGHYNKATAKSKTEKIDKTVYNMDPEKGKFINYIYNKEMILRRTLNNRIVEEVKKQKGFILPF